MSRWFLQTTPGPYTSGSHAAQWIPGSPSGAQAATLSFSSCLGTMGLEIAFWNPSVSGGDLTDKGFWAPRGTPMELLGLDGVS